MAFAIASGLPPQSGIYCANRHRLPDSALGGSRCQGRWTDRRLRRRHLRALVAKHGVDGLFHVHVMAGVLLVVWA